MKTFTDRNGKEWPTSIEVAGETLCLRLIDFQTGDTYTPEYAEAKYHPDTIKWLEVIYME